MPFLKCIVVTGRLSPLHPTNRYLIYQYLLHTTFPERTIPLEISSNTIDYVAAVVLTMIWGQMLSPNIPDFEVAVPEAVTQPIAGHQCEQGYSLSGRETVSFLTR